MSEVQDGSWVTGRRGLTLTPDLLGRFFLHELRQPLTAAKAVVQMSRGESGRVEASDADLIALQLQRIEELAASFHALLAGSVCSGPIDVRAAVEHCLELRQSPRSGATIDVSVPEGLIAWGSLPALHHALTNLLQNAEEAVLAGVPHDVRRISVCGLCDGAWVKVRIMDNGPGICGDIARRLFSLGATSKPVKEGHGLGLALSRELMVHAGGDLVLIPRDAASMPTCFEIRMAAHAPAPRVQGALRDPRGGGRTVLVVDDEEVVLRMLETFLQRQGYTVFATADGARALELIAREPLDVLLTDKNLVGMSGIQLIEAARKKVPPPGTILITGYATPRSAEQSLRLGVDAYLTKPFELDELQEAIDKVTRGRSNRASLTSSG